MQNVNLWRWPLDYEIICSHPERPCFMEKDRHPKLVKDESKVLWEWASGQKNMGCEINEGIFKFFLKWHLTRACSCVVCSVSCFLHQHAMCFLSVPWLNVR
ncbi:hypothetical protein NC653_008689 [Populus alba x Populus x berolinensis]|uniref:Uncharacterized protein n=1 Tax=Populus alba x Populus x berolinensis TaxID=444605 RepID=A0AAD6R7F6_9ROSI|nr:hypothetical protein NC653_008689 [Populus alba x Populus x berolinensis]